MIFMPLFNGALVGLISLILLQSFGFCWQFFAIMTIVVLIIVNSILGA